MPEIVPGVQLGIRIDVYHHFDEGIPIRVEGPVFLGRARQPAAKAILSLGEAEEMATVSVTVDTTNEVAKLVFVDDHGDTDAAQPEGTTVSFSSSDESVLTIAPSADNPLVGVISVVAEGSADVGAAVTNDADGSAWGDPIEATTVTVTAGAAVGARLSVEAQ